MRGMFRTHAGQLLGWGCALPRYIIRLSAVQDRAVRLSARRSPLRTLPAESWWRTQVCFTNVTLVVRRMLHFSVDRICCALLRLADGQVPHRSESRTRLNIRQCLNAITHIDSSANQTNNLPFAQLHGTQISLIDTLHLSPCSKNYTNKNTLVHGLSGL